MTLIRFFPYAVAVMQLAAGFVYTYHRDWRLAIIWLTLAVSNFAFAGIK